MPLAGRPYRLFVLLLSLAFAAATLPGGFCVCPEGDGAAAQACADEGDGGCGQDASGHGCAAGCAVICCAHPPVIATTAAPQLERESIVSRVSPALQRAMKAADRDPLFQPPRT